jgi:hypothetical protein
MVRDRKYKGMVGDRIDGDAFSRGEKRILRLNLELLAIESAGRSSAIGADDFSCYSWCSTIDLPIEATNVKRDNQVQVIANLIDAYRNRSSVTVQDCLLAA